MSISPYLRGLRDVVGHARLLVASVSAIVRDAEGRLLLVQHREDAVWSIPGGTIEIDEIPADAVVREVWEETGLLVTPTRLLAVYGGPAFVVRYPNGDETQYVSAIFECEVQSGILRADGDEVQSVRYWSLAEAAQLPLSPW